MSTGEESTIFRGQESLWPEGAKGLSLHASLFGHAWLTGSVLAGKGQLLQPKGRSWKRAREAMKRGGPLQKHVGEVDPKTFHTHPTVAEP